MIEFLTKLTMDEISSRVIWSYWPIILGALCYVPFLFTSIFVRKQSVVRIAWLNMGSSMLLTIWGLITIIHIISAFDAPHGRLVPQWFFLVGIDATYSLGLVFVVAAMRAVVSRRLELSASFSIGGAATIGAVYGNLVFALLLTTPFK